MGELRVQAHPSGAVVWSRLGHHHINSNAAWSRALVTINAPRFLIIGFRGEGHRSDVAVDDVSVTCAFTPLPPPPPSPPSPPGISIGWGSSSWTNPADRARK